jgi:MFS transporter, DHA3 family, macrolide efflux protein
MLLSSILVGLVLGALAGGHLPRLADLRLKWIGLLGMALAVRILAGLQIATGVGAPAFAEAWGLPLTYGLIVVWLYRNWKVPGLQVAAIGVTLNTIAVLLHGGRMPVFEGSLIAAGLTAADLVGDPFHVILAATSTAEFVRQGGMFGDVVPIPIPVLRDVISVGDVLLWLGIVWAIAAAMTRREAPSRLSTALGTNPPRPMPAGEFQLGVAYATAIPLPAEAVPELPGPGIGVALPGEEEEGQSPYLRLATNRNYALLWSGQLVSLMGDRLHQIALGFLVATRGTPLEVGFTFAAIAIPNVIFGPWAGALADRWDRRRTMIGADLIRAVLVLLVPLAFNVSITLVYVVAFLVATVGLVFRPSKDALVPQIVDRDDLMAANSATSVTETLADLVGYPLAGLMVAALASIIGTAFVIDSGTYLISAALLALMHVAPVEREVVAFGLRQLWRDVREGVAFLATQAELRANTLVSTVGQVAVGTEVTCSVLYAQTVLDQSVIGFPENWSLLMAAIGLGSIIGGLVIGGLAGEAKKGPMAIAGFIGLGLAFILTGLVTDPVWAIGLFFLAGVANMAFVIPNITLFQERTPQALFARVVTSRQALVFGVMAAAMAVSGILAGIIGADRTLMLGGAVAVAAGLMGLLIPSMRNAA